MTFSKIFQIHGSLSQKDFSLVVAAVQWSLGSKRQVSVYLSHAAERYMSEQILIERLGVNLVLKLRTFVSLFTYIGLSPLFS